MTKGKPITLEQKYQMREMYERGMNYSQISKEMGLSKSAVRCYAGNPPEVWDLEVRRKKEKERAAERLLEAILDTYYTPKRK